MSITVAQPRTCQHTFETYGPHAGCAEFMSQPEEFSCGETAVVRLVFKHEPYQDEYLVVTEETGYDLCRSHAEEYKAEPGNDELIRETSRYETMRIERKSGEPTTLVMESIFVDDACRESVNRILDTATGAYITGDMKPKETMRWIVDGEFTLTPGSRNLP